VVVDQRILSLKFWRNNAEKARGATGLPHVCGIVLGLLLRWPNGEDAVRACGLVIGGCPFPAGGDRRDRMTAIRLGMSGRGAGAVNTPFTLLRQGVTTS
jgi:hypothetical protein